MRFCIFIITLSLFPLLALSQYDKTNNRFKTADSLKKSNNIIYGQIAGESCSISANFEKVIAKFHYLTFSARLGIGYFPWIGRYSYPLTLQGFYGKLHNVEIGLGLLYGHDASQTEFYRSNIAFISYRYQKPNYMCRLTICLLDNRDDSIHFIPGLSIGYCF